MSVTFPPLNPRVGDAVDLRNISVAAREALKGNIVFQGALHIVPVRITSAVSPFSVVGSCIILADATSGAITINLPPVADASGFVYFIKKADSGGNAVTIDGDDSETIDGSTTLALSAAWSTATIVCDGTQWLTL